MRIIEEGNLFLMVDHENKKYMLAYTHGLDVVTIYEMFEDLDEPYKFINYFHGGFSLELDNEPYSDILENAIYYIERGF